MQEASEGDTQEVDVKSLHEAEPEPAQDAAVKAAQDAAVRAAQAAAVEAARDAVPKVVQEVLAEAALGSATARLHLDHIVELVLSRYERTARVRRQGRLRWMVSLGVALFGSLGVLSWDYVEQRSVLVGTLEDTLRELQATNLDLAAELAESAYTRDELADIRRQLAISHPEETSDDMVPYIDHLESPFASMARLVVLGVNFGPTKGKVEVQYRLWRGDSLVVSPEVILSGDEIVKWTDDEIIAVPPEEQRARIRDSLGIDQDESLEGVIPYLRVTTADERSAAW